MDLKKQLSDTEARLKAAKERIAALEKVRRSSTVFSTVSVSLWSAVFPTIP